MPLYARTEKRIRRKEREDKLGITAVKDAMKENGELEGSSDEDDELDHDESESELDDEDEDEDEDESEMEDEEDDGDEEDSEVEGADAGEGGDSDEDEEDEDEDEDSDSGPDGDDERRSLSLSQSFEPGSVWGVADRRTAFPLTIDEVESNPIYPMDDNEGCLLCPGKTLKNPKMKETHLASTVRP